MARMCSMQWPNPAPTCSRSTGAWTSPTPRGASAGASRLQGNLDPCALAAPPERIAAWVRELRDAGRAARGHVLNLGHGCLPETPVDGVRAFTDAARTLT